MADQRERRAPRRTEHTFRSAPLGGERCTFCGIDYHGNDTPHALCLPQNVDGVPLRGAHDESLPGQRIKARAEALAIAAFEQPRTAHWIVALCEWLNKREEKKRHGRNKR